MRQYQLKYLMLLICLAAISCAPKRLTDEELTDKEFDHPNLAVEVINDSLKIITDSSLIAINQYSNDTVSVEDGFSEFSHNLDTVTIDSTLYYIVEGDQLLDIDELYNYYDSKPEINDTSISIQKNKKLIQAVHQGIAARWEENHVIRYCIAKNTFQSPANYNQVIQNMKLATEAWEKTCNVKFQYVPDKDNSPSGPLPATIDFVVREMQAGGSFIAKGFFPYDPPMKRKLIIDLTYYQCSFDKVGVLRHELGHVLGFRHEHIRSGAPAACGREGEKYRVLGMYDPKSVMHYFCGGVGTKELMITDIDKAGAILVYGQAITQ